MRVGLIALALCGSILFAETNRQAAATTTERTSFAPGGLIRVIGSYGSLRVEGWDRPEVEVTVTKSMPYDFERKNKDKTTQHLDRIKVITAHPSATEVTITTSVPRTHFPVNVFSDGSGEVMLDYLIHVPRDSKLAIHHGTGYILVSDVAGDIQADCHRGDIVLMLPETGPYQIDARSKLGNVLSDFDGDAHVQHLVGERFSAGTGHNIRLRMGFGSITIKKLQSSYK